LPLVDFTTYESSAYLITSFSLSVAPIYYAHLAAAQVAKFTKLDDMSETSSSHTTQAAQVEKFTRLDDTSETSSSHATHTQEAATPVPELPRLHVKVASSMFFC
jgi:hypothetical protein